MDNQVNDFDLGVLCRIESLHGGRLFAKDVLQLIREPVSPKGQSLLSNPSSLFLVFDWKILVLADASVNKCFDYLVTLIVPGFRGPVSIYFWFQFVVRI